MARSGRFFRRASAELSNMLRSFAVDGTAIAAALRLAAGVVDSC